MIVICYSFEQYTKLGEYHKVNKIENQDYIYSQENKEALFFAVADGVSSCKNSRAGAEIACKVSAKVILNDVDYYFASKPEKTIRLLLSNIKSEIHNTAIILNQEPISFASTLCFACINKQSGKIMLFVLGDSKIYCINKSNISQINRVQSYGENITCSTMTQHCETDARLELKTINCDDVFLLCTDGCWKTLFKTDDNRIAMLEENIDYIDRFLDKKTINDDCSYILIA